jgi:hypothetical protein
VWQPDEEPEGCGEWQIVDTRTGQVQATYGDCMRDPVDSLRQTNAAADHARRLNATVAKEICERCGRAGAGAPYCQACLRDFDAHRIETEWSWRPPR